MLNKSTTNQTWVELFLMHYLEKKIKYKVSKKCTSLKGSPICIESRNIEVKACKPLPILNLVKKNCIHSRYLTPMSFHMNLHEQSIMTEQQHIVHRRVRVGVCSVIPIRL